jgi:hypothetical protein
MIGIFVPTVLGRESWAAQDLGDSSTLHIHLVATGSPVRAARKRNPLREIAGPQTTIPYNGGDVHR